MVRIAISLILLTVSIYLASAQQSNYLLEAYTYRQGLSDNRVRAVMQDEKGFIWIGTANGLNRFDGYNFWHYFPDKNDSTSISSVTVNEIVKDRQGSLWMATGNGICRLRRGPWKFERVYNYPGQISEQRLGYIENVYPDPHGRVWITDAEGLVCISPDQKIHKRIVMPVVPNAPAIVPANYRDKPARPIWVSGCGDTAVIIGTNYGLFQLQTRSWTFRFFPVHEAWPFGLSHLSPGGPNSFWGMTFDNGAVQVDLSTGQTTHFPREVDPTPQEILPRPDGKWWMVGLSGLTEISPGLNHAAKIKLPLEEDVSLNATTIFKDRAGVVWIGTDNGLVKYDPHLQGFHYTEVHRETSTIYENDIYDVFHNPDDGLWYVSSRQQSAIFILDSLGRMQARISTLPYTDPSRIFRDSKNKVWVTTRWQVLQLDTKTRKLTVLPTPPRRDNRGGLIWAIAEDPKGRLWFGLSRDGLLIYDPHTQKFTIPGPADGFDALRIIKIVMDRAGRYAWIITDGNGFYECNLATMKFRRFSETPREELISAAGLVQDGAGNVWIATHLSLLRYDPSVGEHSIRAYTVADGLPMNALEGGIMDLQGNLWFGAGDRLVRIDPRTDRIKTFDYRYDASKTPFGYCDFSISPSGEVYAGGRRGFLRWHPERLEDNHQAPTVVVTNLRAAREDVPAPTSEVDRIWLQSNENNFRVEFAALNFTLPDENLYQWKLERYDKEWSQPSRQREAIYAHIPPGEYRLLVKAANNDGVWNPKPLSIKVQIFPAFWQTIWFRLSVLAGIGSLIYGFIRWRIQVARERERLQSTFNERLAEVEMSALRAQMNPHFIFNCLNSINRFILLNQPLVASQYLTKFARLIRLVLDNSKSEMISLEKELDTLRLYIEMESVRFEGRFQFVFDVDEAIDPGCMDIPPMLIQPYVENAIWHGLLHRKGNDGLLEIHVHLKNNNLLFSIKDNGVGRAAAQALKSKSASEHKSHGMNVTAERLKLLSNLYGREIRAQVNDLLARDGSPAGTEVVLTIPVLG